MINTRRKDDSLSIERIKEAAQGRILDILEHVAGVPAEYLDGKHHPCPKCGGKDRFRLIDSDAGGVFCNQCFNEGNGDFLAAVQHFCGVSLPESLRSVADYLGNSPATPKPKPTSKKLVATWVYSDADGKPLYRVKRYEWTENGEPEKSFIQERFAGGKWEKGIKNVSPVPFNWPAITERSDEPVFIVEGEKCCEALTALGFLATTASGGSNSKLDWAQFLKRRRVTIFPDNDRPGYEYALKVADQLHGSGCEISVVFLSGSGELGSDLASSITES